MGDLGDLLPGYISKQKKKTSPPVSLGRVAFTKQLRVHPQTSAGASVAPREQPWLICPSSLEHHRGRQDTFHKNMNRSGLSQTETLRPLPLRDKCLLGLRPFARYPASYGNLASSGKTRRQRGSPKNRFMNKQVTGIHHSSGEGYHLGNAGWLSRQFSTDGLSP